MSQVPSNSAFKSGLQHYATWGRKEGREGFALVTALSTVATSITGQDVQLDRLHKTLRQLSRGRLSSQ